MPSSVTFLHQPGEKAQHGRFMVSWNTRKNISNHVQSYLRNWNFTIALWVTSKKGQPFILPLWDCNFLYIFEVLLSKNRYEKGCKILERMFLVFYDTINLLCIEHTTKRDVSSSLLEATNPLMPIVQKFNVTLPVTSIGGKYTRVFDTRLRMGEPHRLYVQSTEWLLPIKSRWPKSLQLIWCF